MTTGSPGGGTTGDSGGGAVGTAGGGAGTPGGGAVGDGAGGAGTLGAGDGAAAGLVGDAAGAVARVPDAGGAAAGAAPLGGAPAGASTPGGAAGAGSTAVATRRVGAGPSTARGDTVVLEAGPPGALGAAPGTDCDGVNFGSGGVASERALTASSTASSAHPETSTARPTVDPAIAASMPRRSSENRWPRPTRGTPLVTPLVSIPGAGHGAGRVRGMSTSRSWMPLRCSSTWPFTVSAFEMSGSSGPPPSTVNVVTTQSNGSDTESGQELVNDSQA